MEIVDMWTGRRATALRNALRMTSEGFAEVLGTSTRTVTKWSTGPDVVPYSELQRALDTVLARATSDEKGRFLLLVSPTRLGDASPSATAASPVPGGNGELAANAELRVSHDPNVNDVLDWLDDHAKWEPGEARRRVTGLLRRSDVRSTRDRGRRRGRTGRKAIAEALADYYAIKATDPRLYKVSCGNAAATSILSRPEWLNLGLILGRGDDHIRLRTKTDNAIEPLDELAAQAAAVRVAETLATDTRLVNRPLYRMLDVNIATQALAAEVGLTDFGTYALTMDLLEGELLDAIIDQRPMRPGTLPLRDRYLPTVDSVTDLAGRICAGGPLALFAAARPANRRRPAPDYVLLVQERSGRVLNTARRLAVIPKSFHEPLVDFSDDAQISATLEREMEEELFGRTDVDSTTGERRYADPLNVSRLSQPMHWLINRADTDDWRMECTGFGINLVSGNFEFASLVVIDSEEWWEQFGGQVEANWESEGLRRYSSRDREGLADLVQDPAWSNEGLFAFTLGLQRLSEVGTGRVRSPLTVQEG